MKPGDADWVILCGCFHPKDAHRPDGQCPECSCGAPEEPRFTLAEVLRKLGAYEWPYGYPKSWSDLESDVRAALQR